VQKNFCRKCSYSISQHFVAHIQPNRDAANTFITIISFQRVKQKYGGPVTAC